MKAKQMLLAIAQYDICKGQSYIDAGNQHLLTILKGELKPKTLYYHSFKIPTYIEDEPDVKLTLGTED